MDVLKPGEGRRRTRKLKSDEMRPVTPLRPTRVLEHLSFRRILPAIGFDRNWPAFDQMHAEVGRERLGVGRNRPDFFHVRARSTKFGQASAQHSSISRQPAQGLLRPQTSGPKIRPPPPPTSGGRARPNLPGLCKASSSRSDRAPLRAGAIPGIGRSRGAHGAAGVARGLNFP